MLPGSRGDRARWIFETHGYKPPTTERDWLAVADLAAEVEELLLLIATRNHAAAVERLNRTLSAQQVTPFVDQHHEAWVLHFHSPEAGFADGWAGASGRPWL